MSSSNNSNPYEPGRVLDHSSVLVRPKSAKSAALTGALWAIALSFPIAGFMALVFRFPVPIAGMVSGPRGIIPAMIAVAVYGVFLGGFAVIAVTGALAGILLRAFAADSKHFQLLYIAASAVAALVPLFVLATLDWYIGPW